MKKIVSLFALNLLVLAVNAQDVVAFDENGNILENVIINEKEDDRFQEALPANRIPCQIVVKTLGGSHIKTSSGLKLGKIYYLFEVVEAEDTSLVGKSVACQIMSIRKSNISGSEGRFILRPLYVSKDSTQVPIAPIDIYRRGLNRANIKFWLSPLIIPIFIAGSKAEIFPNERLVLTLETHT